MPKVSIIIVHYRVPELLKLNLKSIENTLKGFDYETIVVDWGAIRKTADMIKEGFPNVRYLPFKENNGYAKGVNTGAENARGEYLLFLNPDIILKENSVQKMVRYMEEHPDIGILGPKLLGFDGLIQHSYFRFYKPITVILRRLSWLAKIFNLRRVIDNFLMLDTNPNKIQTPDWLMGSVLMVSRQALNKVGKMDERFFMYFEDVDWCRRFWQNGYKVVYYPEAVMYHYHQRESYSGWGPLDVFVNRTTRRHIKSGFKYFFKYRNINKPTLKLLHEK
ncbi:MAG: putative glycosyltransferase [Parcubacteria group bacterium Licking1014_17]|nr:MAG: putative glycosyltransferase [Parcubacteria group bacterium Licking1014_17]